MLFTLERYLFPKVVQLRYQLISSLQSIYTATNSPSYDSQDNFENKELIGDSVLKFITCYCLFTQYPGFKVDQLSELKGRLVSNFNLMNLGKELDVQKYIWTIKKHPKNWTPTGVVSLVDKGTINIINGKMIADVVEALIGACLETRYLILDPLIFLH